MTDAEAKAWLATLTPAQLGFVECILRLMPNYRYDLSRFPPLDPVLARGLPSIVAMVEAVTARIDAGLVAVACQGAPLGDGRGSSLRAAW